MDSLGFQGGDGKTFQAYVLNYLHYAPRFQVNILSPLQGAFAPQLPINTWLNPGYVVFRLFDREAAIVASLAVSFLALAIPTYVLARASGLGRVGAGVAAQMTIIAFPPFYVVFGLHSQYTLVPPTAVTVGLQTLALVVVLRTRSGRPAAVATSGALIAVLFYCALVVDPLFFIAALMSMMIVTGVFVVGGRDRSIVLGRVATFLVSGLILYALGGVDFVVYLIKVTARDFYKAEFLRSQIPSDASMLFAHPVGFGRTLVVLAAGWILGLCLTSGRRRLLAAACVVHWGAIAVQATVYLFANVDWPGLLPTYLEVAAFHVYLAGAVSGWLAGAERALTWSQRRRPTSWLVRHPSLLLTAVPLALVAYRMEVAPAYRSTYGEPWPREDCLIRMLGPEIGRPPRSSSAFKGSAVVVGGRDYDTALSLTRLWREGIPTLNEYSQLVTVPMYYVGARLFASPPDSVNFVTFQRPDLRLLALLGARFIVTRDEERISAGSRQTCTGTDAHGRSVRWYIQSIPEANLGHYSPIDVRRATSAVETLAALRDPQLDFRRSVVVNDMEELPALSPATRVTLTVEAGRFHVRGRSASHSLIVLPIQYSRCLSLVGADSARLFRTNLLITGLLFSGDIDAELRYAFGFFHPGCRRADHDDLLALNYASDVRPPAGRHPFAVTKLEELPQRVADVARFLSQAAKEDVMYQFGFHGPVGRVLRKCARYLESAWFWR